jgi:hypothetical protein
MPYDTLNPLKPALFAVIITTLQRQSWEDQPRVQGLAGIDMVVLRAPASHS